MTRPLVSFLMGVHNEEAALPKALEAVASQAYEPWELVVVDDASADRTWEILQTAASKDPRVRAVRNEENLGLTRSLNKGLALARGEFVARRDPDDFHDSDSVELQMLELERAAHIQAVSSDYLHLNGAGEVLREVRVHAGPLITAWCLIYYNRLGIHSGVVFRAQTVRNLGGYDERYRYAQDFDLWQRVSREGDIAILPRFLTRRTYGEDGSISKDKAKEQEACAEAMASARMRQLAAFPPCPDEVRALRSLWLGRPVPVGWIPRMNRSMRMFFEGLRAEPVHGGRTEGEWKELRQMIARRWRAAKVPWWGRWAARRAARVWS